MDANEYLKKWSGKLRKGSVGAFQEQNFHNYVTFRFGSEYTNNPMINAIGMPSVFSKENHIHPYMTVSMQPFPACCGMNIMHTFGCQSPFTPEDYWEFLQLILDKMRKPCIGIISNAGGYSEFPSNIAIEKNAQFISKTRNHNYGSCVSTYMIYPSKMKNYLSSRLEEYIPYGDWKE